MGAIRNFTPKRRDINSKVNTHGDHKDDLRLDYQQRCGYCADLDTWRFAWFEVDHFVPVGYLKTMTKTDYRNLVYSCRSCNNAKRAKWPTKDEVIHHQNDEGFIDPCDDDYNNHFERDDNGRIAPLSKLGIWKYNALQLYKPQHEIIWNIEQLEILIAEVKAEVVKQPQNIELKDRLLATHEKFQNYLHQLFKM